MGLALSIRTQVLMEVIMKVWGVTGVFVACLVLGCFGCDSGGTTTVTDIGTSDTVGTDSVAEVVTDVVETTGSDVKSEVTEDIVNEVIQDVPESDVDDIHTGDTPHSDAVEGDCLPTTCVDEGKNCGTISSGCGDTLTCGTCSDGNICGGAGEANICGGAVSGAAVLIAQGATWKYLADGSDAGTTWKDAGFDDSGWASGPAEFGYGEDDEATVVSYGSDSSAKYITTYFRTSFSLATSYTSLTLNVLVDDGAVVYLNGTEIGRVNLPEGTITYTTLASSNIGQASDEGAWTTLTPATTQLVNGTNVVAVEVHQYGATSSDLSFDLRLLGQ